MAAPTSSPCAASADAVFEQFGRLRGILHPDFAGPALRESLGALAPGHSADMLLQAGRNRTFRRTLGSVPGLDVAVKSFGPQPFWQDLVAARRGSKALRAYRAAAYLHARGIGTPAPVAVLERREGVRLAESFLITRFEPGLCSFRRELIETYARGGSCAALMALLETVAEAVAAMHDAGFLHRDLGNQNLFLTPPPLDGGRRRVLVLDLNRGRVLNRPPTLRERARDLSRLHLPSDFRRVFLEMYWRGAVPPAEFLRRERRFRRRYAWHAQTRRLRHPFRVPPEPSPDGEYPPDRELWIWDERSAQAIPAFRSRDRHRLRERTFLVRTAAAALRCALPAWRHHRRLRATAFGAPVVEVGERAAVALDGLPETLERELAQLRELGARNVLLRLYHHEDDARRGTRLDAVERLHAEGFGVALALVQDRRAVRDPAAWDAFGRAVLRRVGARVRWVEVGHAVNRVKWGLWGYRDLAALLAPAAAWRRDFPSVRLTGPAAIDFEPATLAAALRALPRDLRFATLSHHLYVDRRGAPESRQGPFDALGKLALLRALGEGCGRCGPGLIVSAFNWPLAGTGVWSPVGSPYESPGVRRNDPSVGERRAALYLVRYLLLGICSGLADEMVFWRLAAHGFGLVDDRDPAGWRRRPAFDALKAWYGRFRGAGFLSARIGGGAYELRFRAAGGDAFRVVWQAPDPAPGGCPLPPGFPSAATDAFGRLVEGRALQEAWAEGNPLIVG